MNQQVKYFRGGWGKKEDTELASKIETYAWEHNLIIQSISYTKDHNIGHALVVFVPETV